MAFLPIMSSKCMDIIVGVVVRPCKSIFGEITSFFFLQTCKFENRFCPDEIADFNLKR